MVPTHSYETRIANSEAAHGQSALR
jgi:hypothetical protein